jgi:hypothetical protein
MRFVTLGLFLSLFPSFVWAQGTCARALVNSIEVAFGSELLSFPTTVEPEITLSLENAQISPQDLMLQLIVQSEAAPARPLRIRDADPSPIYKPRDFQNHRLAFYQEQSWFLNGPDLKTDDYVVRFRTTRNDQGAVKEALVAKKLLSVDGPITYREKGEITPNTASLAANSSADSTADSKMDSGLSKLNLSTVPDVTKNRVSGSLYYNNQAVGFVAASSIKNSPTIEIEIEFFSPTVPRSLHDEVTKLVDELRIQLKAQVVTTISTPEQ